ncbi:MAG: 30S ribosomal protein S6 [Candidatus Omnitrophota bacterium]
MGLYEGLFIVRPDLNEESQKTLYAQIEEPITKNGGTIETAQEWGRRALAYPIRKKREGLYYLVRFQVNPGMVTNLRKHYSLNESILRTLITRLGG